MKQVWIFYEHTRAGIVTELSVMALKLKEVKEQNIQTGKHLNQGYSVQFSRHSAGLCEWLQEGLALPVFSKNHWSFPDLDDVVQSMDAVINFF